MLFTKLLRRGAPGYIVRLLMFWYAHQTMTFCVLDGEVQSHRNLQCLMGSGKGEFCHRFCLIAYLDDLSVNLKECQTGCIAGGTIVNHYMPMTLYY